MSPRYYRGTPSTCTPRPHTTISRVTGFPPLPSSFSPGISICWGSLSLGGHIPDSNARFSNYGRDLLYLPILGTKGPHPVLADIHGQPYAWSPSSSGVSLYSIWKRTVFVVRILPSNYLAACSVASRITQKSFDLRVSTLGPIFKFFSHPLRIVSVQHFWYREELVSFKILLVFLF